MRNHDSVGKKCNISSHLVNCLVLRANDKFRGGLFQLPRLSSSFSCSDEKLGMSLVGGLTKVNVRSTVEAAQSTGNRLHAYANTLTVSFLVLSTTCLLVYKPSG